MSIQENMALIQRFFGGINEGTTDVLDEVMAPDLVWHGSSRNFGLSVYRDDLSGLFAAFPDAHWTIEDLIAKEDKVVVRWSFQGTQTGAWENLPATGKRVAYAGVSICRIRERKIVQVWNHENLLGLCRQLGFKLLPPK
jgi:steroid delta-isomerase-like uncharacterized protein